MIEVKTKTNILVKPRLNILYMTIYELAERFGANFSNLEVIKKGILERQYIKRINIHYLDENDEIIGQIYFDIDWEKYRVNASNPEGAEFKLDCKKYTYLQISEMGSEIVKYVDKMRRDLNIKDVKMTYKLITKESDDPEQYKAIQEFLSLRNVTETIKYNLSDEFKRNFELTLGLLDELVIGIGRS